jgi:hypothetical protein
MKVSKSTKTYQKSKGIPHGVQRRPLYTDRIDPIAIKIQKTSKFYQFTKGTRREEVLVDRDMGVKYRHHPADTTFPTASNEAAGLIHLQMGASQNKE